MRHSSFVVVVVVVVVFLLLSKDSQLRVSKCFIYFPSVEGNYGTKYNIVPTQMLSKMLQILNCLILILLLLLYYFAKPVQHHAKDPYIKVDHNTGDKIISKTTSNFVSMWHK